MYTVCRWKTFIASERKTGQLPKTRRNFSNGPPRRDVGWPVDETDCDSRRTVIPLRYEKIPIGDFYRTSCFGFCAFCAVFWQYKPGWGRNRALRPFQGQNIDGSILRYRNFTNNRTAQGGSLLLLIRYILSLRLVSDIPGWAVDSGAFIYLLGSMLYPLPKRTLPTRSWLINWQGGYEFIKDWENLRLYTPN